VFILSKFILEIDLNEIPKGGDQPNANQDEELHVEVLNGQV